MIKSVNNQDFKIIAVSNRKLCNRPFLEQIERFDGILIATTNLLENLDKAFSRRFNYKIEFVKPNKAQRIELWKKLLPANLPLEKDFDLKNQRVKSSNQYHKDYNLLIEKKLADINTIEVNYRLSDRVITLDALVSELNNPTARIDFIKFWEQEMERQKEILKEGTYRQQMTVLNKVKSFKSPLFFYEIDENYINDLKIACGLEEIDIQIARQNEADILMRAFYANYRLNNKWKPKSERIKDIKEKPYKKIQLDTQISILDEIKYLDAIQDNMKKYGVEYPRRLLNAFHTALKCSDFSPLAVLSGVSGTGKSELPKLYSHFGGFNFLAEAVQPTWDSPASMIGYYNTIDRKFDSTNILKFLIQTSMSKNESPYGLKESMNMILLDEMNLAHIELYFAEFLSKFEQRRGSKEGDVNIDIQLGTALIHPLPLDRNIIWIGTMNEDETTKTLSDKVLDRAFLINFPRPTELKSRVKLQTLEDIKPFEYLHRDTWNKWIKKESLFAGEKYEIIHKYREISNKINEYLAPTGRAIGHRVWQSMEYYINNHPEVIQNIGNDEELNKKTKLAFEEQLVQKIMPKLRGIEVHGEEKKTLDNIKEILNQNEFAVTEDFELAMDNPYGQFIWNSANYLKED